jgi:F-type H+-transporting ATPase subunit epsilon
MAHLELHVVTPTSAPLNVECDEVIVPGVNGEIGLLPGHVPLITALRPGVLITIRSGQRALYVVSSGFAEIDQDKVSILTDSLENASEVDLDRARRALQSAEEKLKTLGPEDPGYAEAQRRAARASARIEGAARTGRS